MVYYYNIDPIFLKIGFLEIRYYGLIYFLGFLLSYLFFQYLQKKDKLHIKNLTSEKIDLLFIYFIIGGILGGRILNFVFYYPKIFWTNPLEILYIWHGGMSFHGGLIGAIIAIYFFSKKEKIKFYDIADMLVILTSFFLIFGRIANFINGELIGRKTTMNFCVIYPNHDGCRHFSQFYEAGKNLIIFITLTFLRLKKDIYDKFQKGFIFWSFVTLYGILRFLVTFFKEDPLYFGLSIGQWLSLIMFIIGIIILYNKYFKKINKNITKDMNKRINKEKTKLNLKTKNIKKKG